MKAIMKFKKGDKVEVLNKREDPVGSWKCAEIISGNGHNYYVRYDGYVHDVGSFVERVARGAIRPCPPSVECPWNWVPGDIVEVLDNFSWKLAKITRFSRRNGFFVRLLGFSTDSVVSSSGIRVRQCWQDNEWFVIGKDSSKCSIRTTNRLSKEKDISELPQLINDPFQDENQILLEKSARDFTMCVNKRLHCPLPLEKCHGAFRKRRLVEKEGCPQSVSAWNPTKSCQIVDAVASPRTMLGEKYMYSSLINGKARMFGTNQGGGIANAYNEHFCRTVLEDSDAESASSSVGSCSISKSPCRSIFHPVYGLSQSMESPHDLSEASAALGRESCLLKNEALPQEIHNLELHAYRSTVSAFYASGPISWEQEALLTNLRLVLHISNDEYLMELRRIFSSQTDAFDG